MLPPFDALRVYTQRSCNLVNLPPFLRYKYTALCFMSGLIVRYTMYVQGEYNNYWERVGDEETVSGIFRIFRIFANFEPLQNARDKNFRNECMPSQSGLGRRRPRRTVQPTGLFQPTALS
jgi:hypothetical protein